MNLRKFINETNMIASSKNKSSTHKKCTNNFLRDDPKMGLNLTNQFTMQSKNYKLQTQVK